MADSSPIQIIFELLDRASGPASKIDSSLRKADDALQKVSKHSGEAEGFLKKFSDAVSEANDHVASRAIEGLAENFVALEVVEKAAELVGEFVEKLVELGFELGKDILKAGTFEQQTQIVFRALTGSSEAAEDATQSAKKFALQSGIALDQVIGSYQKLLLSGTKLKDVPVLLQAATDVGFITGAGASGRDRLIDFFQRVQSTGRLTAREFMELRGALPIAGFDALAKSLGFSAGEGGRFRGEAVEGRKAIEAVLQALAKAEGGRIGQVTFDMGNTLPGLFTKAKNNWELLLGSVSETKGFKNLVTVVGKFVALLDPAGPQGKAIIAFLEKAADGVAKFLDPFTKPGAAQGFFDKAMAGAKQLITILGQVADALRFISKLAEAAMLPFTASTKLVSGVISKIPSGALSSAASKAGGFLSDVASGATEQVNAVAGALGLPAFASGGEVSGPTIALVGEREPEIIVPKSKIGANGITVNLTQSFSITADSAISTEELARKIAEIGAGELVASLETMSLGMGAS